MSRKEMINEAKKRIQKNPESGVTYAPLFVLCDTKGKTRGIFEATDDGDILLHVYDDQENEVDQIPIYKARG